MLDSEGYCVYCQLIHSVALLAVPLARRPALAGSLMATGMLLFSGSLYALVLTDHKKLGVITVQFNLLSAAAYDDSRVCWLCVSV